MIYAYRRQTVWKRLREIDEDSIRFGSTNRPMAHLFHWTMEGPVNVEVVDYH